MVTIDDIRWLASRQARQFWNEISELPVADTALVRKRARSLFLPSQASLMMVQWELLATAKRKVSEPWKWHWTKLLLEQASDEVTAMDTAQDFPADSQVHDICCGAGADAIALAKIDLNLKIVAYDRCPIACELVRQNATSHSCRIQVVETSAENIQFDANTYVSIDPDRRSEGRRVTNLDSLSPSSEIIQSLEEEVVAACPECSIEYDTFAISFLTLSGRATNVRINERDEPKLTFPSINATFSITEILSKKIYLETLVLSQGYADGVGPDSVTFRFIDQLTKPLPPELQTKDRWRAILNTLEIKDSRLREPFGSSELRIFARCCTPTR